MAKEPEDMVVRLLRDIQSGIASQGKDISSMRDELRRQGVKIDELFESSTMALGLAGHSNVRHETVQKQLEDLTKRIERLEKQK
jgi:uncharacterized protein (UPF0335 family)